MPDLENDQGRWRCWSMVQLRQWSPWPSTASISFPP